MTIDYQTLGLNWLNNVGELGVMITDEALIIRAWNPWLQTHSGRSVASVVGQHLFDVFPDLLSRRLDQAYARALAGEVVVLSQRFHHYLLLMAAGPHEDHFAMMQQSARIAPLYHGGHSVGAITVIEDVTERVANDQILLESEARYRTLSEQSLAGVFLVQDGLFRYINPALAQMLGYQPISVIARLGPLDLVAPASRAQAEDTLGRLLSGAEGSIRTEVQMLRKDGHTIDLEILGNAILMGGERVILGMAMDITQRKRAETFQALQFAVTRVLAEAESSEAAVLRLLRRVCRDLAWDLGEVWWVDEASQHLRWGAVWHVAEPLPQAFVEASRGMTLARGVGLAGTVWEQENTAWWSPLPQPPILQRGQLAQEWGLQAGLGVPVTDDRETIGVLIFLTRETRPAQPDLIALLSDIGGQIGQFVARQRAEEALRRRDAILEAVRFAAAQFLQAPDWRDSIEAVVARLGQAMQVSRVSLFANRTTDRDDLLLSQEMSWTAPTLETGALAVPESYAARGLARWPAILGQGQVIHTHVHQLPAPERGAFACCGVRSLLAAPIFAGQQWWGFIQFEEVGQPRTWTEVEIGALRAATDALGAAIARQRVEDLLRQREARLRQITDNMLDMVSQINLDGVLEYVSPSHYPVLGYRPEALLGRSAYELIHPDDVKLALSASQTGLQTGIPSHIEYRYRHAEGHYVWLESVGNLLYGENGEPMGAVMASHDVTERRRSEDAMRQAQKLESLGVVAGGVAHDFNNLLAGMMMQITVAQAKLQPDSPALTHLQKVLTSAQRAADLTRQLLAYAGKGQFQVQDVDLNRLISDNIDLLQATTPHHVTMTQHLAPDLPSIVGDLGQVQQVVMNLVMNAAEATENGQGQVTLTTGVQTVTEEHLPDFLPTARPLPGHYVTVAVTDNGVGMDAETLSRIFDPFFTTKFTGRGLGLSATLGITRAMHGGLQVQSTPGVGTTFRVFFPAVFPAVPTPASAEDLPAPAPVLPAASVQTQPRSTILVIDDEMPVREALTDIFEDMGWPVLTAANGREGLEVFHDHRAHIGVVLLDLLMPVMGGEETLTALRQLDPALRILVVSAYDETEVLRRFAKDPALRPTAVLQKPYDLSLLIDLIQHHIAASNESPS
ncbi:MAG: PAS domain S-box protein [Anaerolineae bacterium]